MWCSYKSNFLTYFDGVYDIAPKPNVSNSYEMGITKLEFDELKKTLTVHLRRPGLLIGKGGRIINDVSDYLGCKINIVETKLLEL